MKILLACLLLAISLISSCSCACSFDPETGTSTCETYTQWTEDVGGAVSWAKDCDFTGHDVAKIDGPEHNCGKLCYDYSGSKCTHFTWSKGICYIKSNARKKVLTSSYLSIYFFLQTLKRIKSKIDKNSDWML